MAALGSLVVSLGLDAVDFTAGLTKAEREAQLFSAKMDRIGKAAGTALGIGAAAAAAGLLALVAVTDQLVKAAGNYQDFAEKVGDSAENIASLAVAAGTAGTSMETIVSAAAKLTKGLTGVDDESQAAGAALTALGLDVEQFKKLQAADQMEAVAKALAGFKEGAGKTAIAMALFGKAGADLLPFLKELGQEGGRQVILTERQIRLADDYADKQAKLRTQFQLFAQAAATEALPAMTALTEAFTAVIREMTSVDQASGRLALNEGVRTFATNAAVAVATVLDSVIFLAKGVRALGGSFEAVFADAKAAFAFNPVSLGADFGENGLKGFEAARERIAKAFEEREKTLAESNKRYVDLWNSSGTQVADAVKRALSKEQQLINEFQSDPRELARRGRGPAVLRDVNFNGPEKKERKAPAISEAQRYLETLQKQAESLEHLTTLEHALTDIQKNRLDGITPKLREQIIEQAKAIDQAKYEAEQRRNLEDAIQQELQARLRAADVATDEARSLRASNDAMALEIQTIGANAEARYALEQARLSSALALAKDKLLSVEASDQIGIETQAIRDQITELERRQQLLADRKSAEEVAAQVQQMEADARRLRETIEGTIGTGLLDIMNGNFKNIGDLFVQMINRMVAEALAADLSNALFGKKNATGGSSGGGLLDGLISFGTSLFAGRAIGGAVEANSAYKVNERGTPEMLDINGQQLLLTGNQRGHIDPNPQRSSGMRPLNLVQNFTVAGNVDRRSQAQVAASAGAGVQRALARDN